MEMYIVYLLDTSFILLLAGIIVGVAMLWKPVPCLKKVNNVLFILATICLTLVILLRGVDSGRLPFASMYEFTLLFIWGILLFSTVLKRTIQAPTFDLAAGILVLFLLSLNSIIPSDSRPLMPALQSTWLHFHVATAVVAYGFFGVACCLGVMYLIKSKSETREDIQYLDNLIYRLVVGGFIFLTLVIVTGAIWAEQVWGNWWTWDPKETWSLITWLVYAAYLHARRSYSWKEKKSALIVVVGFAVVLFTLFGVSFLLSGLHSYI
ncbi:c-type cytochrome biogenesis protein CcsB [Syntrophomonas erecta subsp. sporosyntropha]